MKKSDIPDLEDAFKDHINFINRWAHSDYRKYLSQSDSELMNATDDVVCATLVERIRKSLKKFLENETI